MSSIRNRAQRSATPDLPALEGDGAAISGKQRAPRNRTLDLSPQEFAGYSQRLIKLKGAVGLDQIDGRTIHQDLMEVMHWLPAGTVDLLFVDPPYNLTKNFGTTRHRQVPQDAYEEYVASWLVPLLPVLKPNASAYICCDYRSSAAVHRVVEKHFTVINRITWEREKGRGAKRNWKNCTEDIWFSANGPDYTFNLDEVKLRRRVIAPYRLDGQPKDWQETPQGNYRDTHPSNIWTDLTVPYWSMPENTDHPTQKPEKLLAKIILASSNPGDLVLDPFLGSGTTSVVARKLERRFIGIEQDQTYACLAEKRLALAEQAPEIQGYVDGVFWERNSQPTKP